MAVWTPQAHEEIIERALGGLNPMGSEYRKLSRYHQGNSFEVELDSTGRVTLPGSLLAHAASRGGRGRGGGGPHRGVEQAELARRATGAGRRDR